MLFISDFSNIQVFESQLFHSPGLSGSIFSKVQLFQGPGPESGFRVQIQILDVAIDPGFSGPKYSARAQILEVATVNFNFIKRKL